MNEVVVLTPERIWRLPRTFCAATGWPRPRSWTLPVRSMSATAASTAISQQGLVGEAVAKRWLDRLSAPLLKIAEASGPAPARLEKWLRTMFSIKHERSAMTPKCLRPT